MRADSVAARIPRSRHSIEIRVRAFAERLKDDPELLAKGEELKRELLEHPEVRRWLETLWLGMKRGITDGVANALLVKLNQIGTVTETLDAMAPRLSPKFFTNAIAGAPPPYPQARPMVPPAWAPSPGVPPPRPRRRHGEQDEHPAEVDDRHAPRIALGRRNVSLSEAHVPHPVEACGEIGLRLHIVRIEVGKGPPDR